MNTLSYNLKGYLSRMLFMNIKEIKNSNSVKTIGSEESKKNFAELMFLGGVLLGGLFFMNKDKKMHSWIYRDDIGAPHGIHGYEEQVNSVGMHHGHSHWPSEITWNTYNSAT
jgi:hypothetical protein